MGKSGKGLKAALHSQQNRLKAKEKVSHAALVAEQKSRKKGGQPSSRKTATNPQAVSSVKGKGKSVSAPLRRPTIPFKATDKILLIGEGNFSFAQALIDGAPAELSFLPPSSITATAYDTEPECYEKYPESASIVSFIRDKGVEVIFGVDGTRLEKCAPLKGRKWDRIVWNFPHTGKGITDQDRNILSNQLLILGVLRSAAKMLQLGPSPSLVGPSKKKKKADDDDDEDEADVAAIHADHDMDDDDVLLVPTEATRTRGTVLITLRNVAPYTNWDVPRLAKNPPAPTTGSTPPNPCYTLLRSFQFHRDIWKGYEHRMTKGERAHGKGTTGEGGEDRTWEFCLREGESIV